MVKRFEDETIVKTNGEQRKTAIETSIKQPSTPGEL